MYLQNTLDHERYGKYELASLEDQVSLPYVLKNKLLIGPGTHNGIKYTAKTLKRVYNNTEFEGEATSLFWDHVDTQEGGGARTWIGDIKNIRYASDGVYGDLYIVNKQAAVNLAYGAKFGVSAKVVGSRDRLKRELVDGAFVNWSLVYTPADKNTYLNQQWKTFLNFEESEMAEDTDSKEDAMETENATKKQVEALKDKIATISERLEEAEKKVQEPTPEPTKKEPEGETPQEKDDEGAEDDESPEEPEKKEMNSEEIARLFDSEDSREFVKDYLSKNPTHGLMEAGDAWDNYQDSLRNKKMDELNKKVEGLELQLKPQRKTEKDPNDERNVDEIVASLSDEEVDKAFLTHVMEPSSRKF